MDKVSSSSGTNGQAARPRTVQAPARHEGVGNALRAAFDPGSYGLPDEMARLLSRMDR